MTLKNQTTTTQILTSNINDGHDGITFEWSTTHPKYVKTILTASKTPPNLNQTMLDELIEDLTEISITMSKHNNDLITKATEPTVLVDTWNIKINEEILPQATSYRTTAPKIKAIKIIREHTGCGLKTAKNIVECPGSFVFSAPVTYKQAQSLNTALYGIGADTDMIKYRPDDKQPVVNSKELLDYYNKVAYKPRKAELPYNEDQLW